MLWEPKPGPKSYQGQISTRPDFARLLENVATDNTSYAPLLKHPAYAAGEPIYWRVASVADEPQGRGDLPRPGQEAGPGLVPRDEGRVRGGHAEIARQVGGHGLRASYARRRP